MKKTLLSLAATAAVIAAAAPAAAQTWRGYDNAPAYAASRYAAQSVDRLEWKINAAVQNRVISRGEGRQLLRDLRQVEPIAYRVQTGRATPWERQRLETTLARIDSAVSRYARNDRWNDNRWDNDRGYGYRR